MLWVGEDTVLGVLILLELKNLLLLPCSSPSVSEKCRFSPWNPPWLKYLDSQMASASHCSSQCISPCSLPCCRCLSSIFKVSKSMFPSEGSHYPFITHPDSLLDASLWGVMRSKTGCQISTQCIIYIYIKIHSTWLIWPNHSDRYGA